MPITDTQPATERQLGFLRDLVRDRNWHDTLQGQDWETAHEANTPGFFLAKSEVSSAIDALLKCPKNRAARPAADFLADLPACKYIVTGEQGQRVHVEVVERRNGRRFLNVLIGSPGDWARQNVAIQTQRSLAEKIRTSTYRDEIGQRDLTGAEAAAVRFSREHRCCSACMSPLSDETQPGYAHGLGPHCRLKFGL